MGRQFAIVTGAGYELGRICARNAGECRASQPGNGVRFALHAPDRETLPRGGGGEWRKRRGVTHSKSSMHEASPAASFIHVRADCGSTARSFPAFGRFQFAEPIDLRSKARRWFRLWFQRRA